MTLSILTRLVKFSIILSMLVLTGSACTTDTVEFQSTGIITGADPAMCACCGGWLITIDKSVYRFDALPDNASFSLTSEKFPLIVLLDWQTIAGSCPPNKILITRIKKGI